MGKDKFYNDEGPSHKVYLDTFYIAKTPVTNAEYKLYKDDVKQPFDLPLGKENHPVVKVTWYDARDYATWAGMRLLSEAEWEKAASWEVGTIPDGRPEDRKRNYPWGDEFDETRCNTYDSGIDSTTPVDHYGEKGASPCGAWDMASNTREWCSSLYDVYPYNPRDGRENQTSSGSRVVRGGSFYDSELDARGTTRHGYFPDDRDDSFGFRVGFGARATPA